MDPLSITRSLSRSVSRLRFAEPVTHVYNPLQYARAPHEEYLERFARPGIEAIFLGMNPGPFGMAQTGVPFGDVELVRDWIGIEAPVKRPKGEHPKRPIQGFECARREISGQRWWGWAKKRFRTPERFFARFFVWNFCPLIFLEESGRNRTPDKLPVREKEPLERACSRALANIVEVLDPEHVIGIGKFAEARARDVLGDSRRIGTVLHPSPASPIANRGWEPQAEKQLVALGLRLGRR